MAKIQKPKPLKYPDYNPETMDQICSLLATGSKSLITICKICKISINTVYAWLRTNEEARECYARAKEDQADSKNERVSEIIDKVERGELDPNAARVMIDGIKWQTAHLKPKVYGQKLGVEHSGGMDLTVNVIDRFDGK